MGAKKKSAGPSFDPFDAIEHLAGLACVHPPSCGHARYSECRNALAAAIEFVAREARAARPSRSTPPVAHAKTGEGDRPAAGKENDNGK